MTQQPSLALGLLRPEEDESFDQLLSSALHFPAGGIARWLERLGRENFHAARAGDRIVAGTVLAPLGQWFGGRRVPMVGINGLGVAPDHRDMGAGRALMQSVLTNLHAQGVPLSALYPATLPVYRRLGYERAGYHWSYELPLAAIDVRDTELALEPVADGAYDELYRVYEQSARSAAGHLDRPAWMWRQRLDPTDLRPSRFLVKRGDQSEGYVVYTQGGRSDPLRILDLCILTPAAGRRLLTLFAGYRSMVELLTWNGSPTDPFLYLLRESIMAIQHSKVRLVLPLEWMLRIVDVVKALEARGYPPGLSAELHLELADDLLPANNGPFVLSVGAGRAEVRRGGEGRIRLGIRELASLYTGFMAAEELQTIGTLAGPAAELALATAVFAGPRPWMIDMF